MPPLEEDDALADFQAALVAAMAAPGLSADDIARRLRDDARTAPFAGYVASLEPRCLEVTAALMQARGVRASSPPEAAAAPAAASPDAAPTPRAASEE